MNGRAGGLFMDTANSHSPSMLVCCGRLIAIAVLLWCVLLWPAWQVAGQNGLVGLSIAAVLCAIPAVIVASASGLFAPGSSQATWIALGGSVLRMIFVLMGTLVVRAVQPQLWIREFLVWLVVFYLVMLLTETLLVVRPAQPK